MTISGGLGCQFKPLVGQLEHTSVVFISQLEGIVLLENEEGIEVLKLEGISGSNGMLIAQENILGIFSLAKITMALVINGCEVD